jgi:hypothetical protein
MQPDLSLRSRAGLVELGGLLYFVADYTFCRRGTAAFFIGASANKRYPTSTEKHSGCFYFTFTQPYISKSTK